MKATIKRYNEGSWVTSFVVTTDPVSVVNSEGHVLSAEEFKEWADSMVPVRYEGKQHTPLTDLNSWLYGLASRPLSRLSVQLSE
mgnify:CR=1 FL=1